MVINIMMMRRAVVLVVGMMIMVMCSEMNLSLLALTWRQEERSRWRRVSRRWWG